MKKMILFIGLMLAILFVNCGVFAEEHTVTLTVNGQEEGLVHFDAQERGVILVRAPGATGVRIRNTTIYDWDTGQWGAWEYFDNSYLLDYLETDHRFDLWCLPETQGVAGDIYAEARYDKYWEHDIDIEDETYSSAWEGQSNHVPVSVGTSYTNAFPEVINAELEKSSLESGEFVKASIEPREGLGLGEWYWADFYRRDINDPDSLVWLHGFDFNHLNELYLPVIGLEEGDYLLRVGSTAVGYSNHGEKDLPFTITSGDGPDPIFIVNKDDVRVGEEIYFGIYAPDAENLELEVTKANNPTWHVYRNYGSNGIIPETFMFFEAGSYQMVARDGETVIDVQTISVNSEGYLAVPDLSGLPALLTVGNDLQGSIVADEHTEWLDINIHRVIEGADWPHVFYSHLVNNGTNTWNLVVPSDLLSTPGMYSITADAGASWDFAGMGTRMYFLVEDEASSNPITLKVDGDTQDITDQPSSKEILVEVEAAGASAVRLLRDGWWDVQETPDGRAEWRMGFGNGDYVFIAQMTTNTDWQDENFDWENFNWNNDVEWTNTSNAVKVHVSSPYGNLGEPEFALSPANQAVERGKDLTVIITAPEDNVQFSWADLRRLNTEDPNNYYLEDIEYGHFDCGSDPFNFLIPTFMFEPGDYWLSVGVGAVGWNSRDSFVPVTIKQTGDAPEYGLSFSSNTLQTGENLKIYAWAPDNAGMELNISRDGDPYWEDGRDTGNTYEVWDWGCGTGGDYTFDLTIHYPEPRDDEHVVKTLTVVSEGKLDDPVLNEIPAIHNWNTAINGSFDPVEGASWYDVELFYIRDGYDWEQVYYAHRDPLDDDATTLAFEESYFDEQGLFQLNVNAGGIGIDNGFTEQRILVLDLNTLSEDLVLKINGETDPENIGEIYLYQSLNVSLDRPEDGITAARVWNGHDWEIWAGEFESYEREWNADDDGTVTYIAQATLDDSVAEWGQEHYDDFGEFDWSQVDWSLTSEPVSFEVICFGDLEAPEVTYPNGTTVERGDDLVLSFDAVVNASVYGVSIQQMDGEWIYGGEYSDPGEYSFLTDTLPAGSYRVIVDPRHYGWRGHRSEQVITVTETTGWDDYQPYFKIAKTDVLTNEDFAVAVHMPDAMKIAICHEDVINQATNTWYEDYSDTHVQTFRVPDSGEWVFAAYAQYEEDGDWEPIGDSITVTADAPMGELPITFTGESITDYTQDYTFSVEIGKEGIWIENLRIDMYGSEDPDGFVNLLEQLDQEGNLTVEENDSDESYTVTFTIAANSLLMDTYRIVTSVQVSVMGYKGSYLEKMVFFTDDPSSPIVHNIPIHCITTEIYPITIYAPGASHISMWLSRTAPVPENEDTLALDGYGDSLEGDVIFASDEGYRYITIEAVYPDESSGKITDLQIYAEAPNGDLPDSLIRMQYVWEDGTDLDFLVEHPTAKYIHVEIYERDNPESYAYWDDGENDWDWRYILPEAWFEPGKFYELEVTSSQIGYNYNQKVFSICMLPTAMDTLTLPPNLTTISADAFNGIGVQKIVIPESVTTIGANAFANCPNLLVVEVLTNPDGIDEYAFSPASGPFMFYITEETEETGYRIPEATLIHLGEYEE